MLFWLNKLIGALILPPTGPALVSLAGLVLLRRSPRLGRAMIAGGVVLVLLLAMPPVAGGLTWLVAEGDALSPEAGRDAQAIVILGGGILPDAREYGGDSVTAFSLERARYGAFVARERRLPVAVSGGVVMRGRPEADVIGDLLEREFGVPVRWREVRSRNTHENAVESARLLLPLGVRRILLVTHAVDARRGRREMEAAGFEVVLAPTLLPRMDIRSSLDLFPSMAGYRGSYYALYEVLGNLKASLDGLP
ncbi:MAG: YdcF family protein [Betaproteobacteria bacterium]